MRTGTICRYEPAMLDRFDARTNLTAGDIVRVCRPHGCPPPGTMGHAHVETLAGEFVGLVQCASLTPVRRKLAARDDRAEALAELTAAYAAAGLDAAAEIDGLDSMTADQLRDEITYLGDYQG